MVIVFILEGEGGERGGVKAAHRRGSIEKIISSIEVWGVFIKSN